MNILNTIFRYLLTAACATSSALIASAEMPPRPEELLPQLSEILEASLNTAPELIEETFIQREGEQRLLQAKSDYYPSINLGANFGARQQFRTGAEDTNNFGLTFDARLTRPLYHWGAIEARIEQARINNNTTTLDFLENSRLILRNIRSDYFTLLLNQILLRNEKIRRQNLQNELERVKINFEAGKLSALDYKTNQLDLQKSLLLIQEIEREQKRIKSRFQETAGWTAEINIHQAIPSVNQDSIRLWVASESAKQTQAWTEQTYRALITKNEIKIQDEELTVITARQRPLLNFTSSASQSQTNTSTANNVDTVTLFAGLGVSWNIFDGFETKHQKIEAKLKRRRLESKLDRITAELLQDQQAMIDAIYFQSENTVILEERYTIAKATFSNTQSDYESGRLTENALRASKLQLNELELELMAARAELLMHFSDYYDLTQKK